MSRNSIGKTSAAFVTSSSLKYTGAGCPPSTNSAIDRARREDRRGGYAEGPRACARPSIPAADRRRRHSVEDYGTRSAPCAARSRSAKCASASSCITNCRSSLLHRNLRRRRTRRIRRRRPPPPSPQPPPPLPPPNPLPPQKTPGRTHGEMPERPTPAAVSAAAAAAPRERRDDDEEDPTTRNTIRDLHELPVRSRGAGFARWTAWLGDSLVEMPRIGERRERRLEHDLEARAVLARGERRPRFPEGCRLVWMSVRSPSRCGLTSMRDCRGSPARGTTATPPFS